MMHGYITDEALHLKDGFVQRESYSDQGAGYLNGTVMSFFDAPMSILDPRTSRLTFFTAPLSDQMSIWCDYTHMALTDPINNLTSAQWSNIFNIIEYVIYSTNTVNVADLNTYLTDTNNLDSFGTYRDGSLTVEASNLTVNYRLSTDTIGTPPHSTTIRKYMYFEYMSGTDTCAFGLWIDSAIFKLNYPLSTILNVIAPCAPITFLTIASSNNIQTIIDSNAYFNSDLDPTFPADIISNAYVYYATYVNNNFSATYQIPFTVLYKGHRPSDVAIRQALRELLEGTVGVDPSLWPVLFPDLYTEARVFIIPIWNNTVVLPEKVIYPSVSLMSNIINTLAAIFPGASRESIIANTSILTVDATKMTLAAIPSLDNLPLQTLFALQPTYLCVDGTTADFNIQSTVTQDFNIKLNSAISTLLGGVSTISFGTIDIEGRQYATFISNFMEYCVLYKDSFPIL